MPAFAQWLIDKDETAVYPLFERTRCFLEERFLPEPMQHLATWPRAKAYVDALPHGSHSLKEYAQLCSAEQFTALSDRYLHNHAPHLYQNPSALRTVWGAIIEEHCLPWFRLVYDEDAVEQTGSGHIMRSELVSLLCEAGLTELAEEIGEQSTEVERFEWKPRDEELDVEVDADADEDENEDEGEEFDLYAGEGLTDRARIKGVRLGQQSNVLAMRGWFAGISIRAMALFEYLVCGRRRMPFGYEPGEPFGGYVGYLTTDETWHLDACLRDAKPPSETEAEIDYKRFCEQQKSEQGRKEFHLIDEVLPMNVEEFLDFMRGAALQGLGLIGSVE
jgi:hypothetical protein